ncbi:hypothetical protein [Rhizobium sp. WW_1]|jgi:hypothetical protein|uniref:hypothetical protein n=1 Tax=Rhizobium sp. WW_1 TaxID=1907375 RepID=UPI000FF35648|nr:hypothetical protein [Rhizobium sp. WW_1]RKD73740.1 hypothetical protein BJ928_10187 [Rhizobium sp. WW_1]
MRSVLIAKKMCQEIGDQIVIGCLPPFLLLLIGGVIGALVGGKYGAAWGGGVGLILGLVLMVALVGLLRNARHR